MSAPKPIVVIGAGGFGREVHDIVVAINRSVSVPEWNFLGFIDDGSPDLPLLARRGARFLGPTSQLCAHRGARYVVGIADPQARRRLAQVADAAGLRASSLVHPAATMGLDVHVGGGSIVCSHVSITTNVRIGRHVHLDQNVAIGHDVRIMDYCRVNPGATVSGNVSLEEGVTLGTNCTVIQGVHIGKGTVVGAGAAVIHDLPGAITAVGVPARRLK